MFHRFWVTIAISVEANKRPDQHPEEGRLTLGGLSELLRFHLNNIIRKCVGLHTPSNTVMPTHTV